MLEELKNNGIVTFGHFTLKSGKETNVYINIKKVISYPKIHLQICKEISKLIKPNMDSICGIPYGAISFASYISIDKNIPMIFLRKERKEYGTKKLIEGHYKKGDSVILIEDVVTTGASLFLAADKLIEEGLIIKQIISVFSRAKNKEMKYKDIPIQYLYHSTDLELAELS